jgi:hypothetical protein
VGLRLGKGTPQLQPWRQARDGPMHILSANLNKRGAALTLPTKDCRPPLAPGRRNSSVATNDARLAELTFVQIMGTDPLADAHILLSRQLLLSRSFALFVPTKPYGRTHARNQLPPNRWSLSQSASIAPTLPPSSSRGRIGEALSPSHARSKRRACYHCRSRT